MHDERRKDQGVPPTESDPVAGALAVEDFDAAAVVLACGQLNNDRYFSQAHRALAEVHVPIVKLVLGVAGQLQLTHFCEKLKSVAGIVEFRDLPDAAEYPISVRCVRNPEQIAVPDEAAIAPGHRAPQCALVLVQRNDAVAFLRAETAREDLAVMKRSPHVEYPDKPTARQKLGRLLAGTQWPDSLSDAC